MHLTLSGIAALNFVLNAFAAIYLLSDQVVGDEFYSSFSFETIADPTNGRVEYVNQSMAVAANLTFASRDTFIIRADSTTVLNPDGPGRKSVRIKSAKQYSTHVAIFDIRHMPYGCATWPATWETDEASWPNLGEVDIVEGVNSQTINRMTLHTSPGCTMPNKTLQTGSFATNDCESSANGCTVVAHATNSYGPKFNDIGGGWYAMERTEDFIKIWFWPRNFLPPFDVLECGEVIDTDVWGIPTADFPSTSSCDLDSHFGPNNIIINLTLCGDWAGNVFASDGCPGTCVDYVNNNPGAFVDAYWDFASVRVYQSPFE